MFTLNYVGAKGDNNQLINLVTLYPQTFQLNWISIVILMGSAGVAIRNLKCLMEW